MFLRLKVGESPSFIIIINNLHLPAALGFFCVDVIEVSEGTV